VAEDGTNNQWPQGLRKVVAHVFHQHEVSAGYEFSNALTTVGWQQNVLKAVNHKSWHL
jgi:hypothetical protein